MRPVVRQIVFTHGGGRLGNQVLRFVHWMSWALEHVGEVEVRNVSFWPQARYFAAWRAHPGCVFPLRSDWGDELARGLNWLPAGLRAREVDPRLGRRLQRWGPQLPGGQAISLQEEADEEAGLEGSAFGARVAAGRRTFCSGWRFPAWELVARHQAAVRPYFRPARDFAGPAGAFIRDLRRRHGMLLGVLIRQSDYTDWNNGRFHFSTAEYTRWIRQALDLHAEHRPAVVVASEVWQDPAAFCGLPIHQATGNIGVGGHWFENWVELAQCDLVISAPSTFSATAAFASGVPLWPVTCSTQIMVRDQIMTDALIDAARHPEFSQAVK